MLASIDRHNEEEYYRRGTVYKGIVDWLHHRGGPSQIRTS